MLDCEFGSYKFIGVSVAGVQTALCMPQFKIAFDVAIGQDPLSQMRYFLVTHGHLDHAAGLPYLISQKKLMGHPQPTVIVPEALSQPLSAILKLWSQIEDYPFSYDLKVLGPDEPFDISQSHFVQTFPTYHRIPSQGYALFERKTKLKPEYQNLAQEEIKRLRIEGHDVLEKIQTPQVAFTGDTRIEFVHGPEFIRKSRVLFLEVTFLDDRKTVADARQWGHIHLREFIDVLPLLENEKIVLIHNSARYSLEHAQSLLREALPKTDHERVVIFPRH